jgi:hypothetical protein
MCEYQPGFMLSPHKRADSIHHSNELVSPKFLDQITTLGMGCMHLHSHSAYKARNTMVFIPKDDATLYPSQPKTSRRCTRCLRSDSELAITRRQSAPDLIREFQDHLRSV